MRHTQKKIRTFIIDDAENKAIPLRSLDFFKVGISQKILNLGFPMTAYLPVTVPARGPLLITHAL